MKNLILAATLLVLALVVDRCLDIWEHALVIKENYPVKCVP